MLAKFGWWGTIGRTFYFHHVATLIGFNIVWADCGKQAIKDDILYKT